MSAGSIVCASAGGLRPVVIELDSIPESVNMSISTTRRRRDDRGPAPRGRGGPAHPPWSRHGPLGHAGRLGQFHVSGGRLTSGKEC